MALVSCSLIHMITDDPKCLRFIFLVESNLCCIHQRMVSITLGPNSTLCLTICWVILAVWVPMGSAEPRRLSVALSHSPSGSRASWNWRAKTCSSSNCRCLRDKRAGTGLCYYWFFYCFHWFFEILLCFLLNWDLILYCTAVVFFIDTVY